jgi:hypothetical protein
MIFTPLDYVNAHRAVFALDANGAPQWPGYTPQIKEIPAGNGLVDSDKRYAHVKAAHFDRFREDLGPFTQEQINHLFYLFNNGFTRAIEVAVLLGVPPEFWPAQEACALRVLEYPPMVGSHFHTDFDLLTVNCFRSDGGACMEVDETSKANLGVEQAPADVHLGELYDLITQSPQGREQATVHRIDSDTRCQFSIVFFALPKHSAVLPSGVTVGAWLSERYQRSRT